MLNGIDPLLVIVLKSRPPEDILGPPIAASNTIAGFDARFGALTIPIPIYLSERLTGIYVDSETRSIDVVTKVEPITDQDELTRQTKPPIVTQTAIDTQVTVSLIARSDSILLTALIALMEVTISRLASREYAIHYLNGPTALFGGLLHRFSTSVSPNEDLIRIEMTLSTAAKESPTPKTTVVPVAKGDPAGLG